MPQIFHELCIKSYLSYILSGCCCIFLNASECIHILHVLHIISYFAVKDDSRIVFSVANVEVGHEATFICRSWGTTKWLWKSANKTMYSLDSTILSIDPVRTKDAGYYHCFGCYKGCTKHFIAPALLKVYGESISVLHNFVGLYKKWTNNIPTFITAKIDRKTKLPT